MATAVNFDKYGIWKYLKEPLLKIHEIPPIQQKYMILRGLFVKGIIFQFLRKYRRGTAVNFDKYDIWKDLKEHLLKIHKITWWF